MRGLLVSMLFPFKAVKINRERLDNSIEKKTA